MALKKKPVKAISERTLTDLPADALTLCLSFAGTATLVCTTMSCRALYDAAMEVARKRVETMGLAGEATEEDSDYEVKVAPRGPLPKLFKAELQSFHSRVDPARLEGGDFLYFRVTECDLYGAVDDGDPVPMLLYKRESVEWLQDDMGIRDEWHVDNALEKEEHGSWWEATWSDYFAYTRHLSLHPRYGRPTLSVSALLAVNTMSTHNSLLHQWITEAPQSEREALEADARDGDDAMTVLFRFTIDECHKLRYRRSRGSRLDHRRVEGLLAQIPVPEWQRRAWPFDVLTHRAFFTDMMSRRKLQSPFGGSQTIYNHRSVGDRNGCWFRASLAFYDALESLAKK